jgi:hypothetical protein
VAGERRDEGRRQDEDESGDAEAHEGHCCKCYRVLASLSNDETTGRDDDLMRRCLRD